MIKITLPDISLEGSKLSKIKSNVFLVKVCNDKYIVKQRRKSVSEKFRFLNEIRIYQTLNKEKLNYLHASKAYKDPTTQNLVLEFIDINSNNQPVNNQDFIKAYQELQQINPKRSLILDLYNKFFLSFYYQILMVSIFTISRKLGLEVSLKIIKTFLKLNYKNLSLSKRYWKHGDLHRQNYFYDNSGRLFFIDFENMSYSKKWPIVELIIHCLSYKDKIYFCHQTLSLYFRNIPFDSELWKIDLYSQCKLALLSHSIAVISHTKIVNKKKDFIDLLNLSLDDHKMRGWFEININSKIQDWELLCEIKKEKVFS